MTSKKKTLLIGLVLGVCLCFTVCSCSSLIMSGGSSGGSRVPNLYGNAPTPSEVPAAIVSSSCSLMFFSFVSLLALIVIDQAKKYDQRARGRAEKALWLAFSKVASLSDKLSNTQKKLIAEAESLEQLEKITQENNDSVISGVKGSFERIEKFVLLGEVLTDEMSEAEALDRLQSADSDNGVPVQATINRKTGKAVLKSIRLPRKDFFGKDVDDSSWEALERDIFGCDIDSLTHKCGEGYSTTYDTVIHARFWVINAYFKNRGSDDSNANRRGWEEVGPGDVMQMRDKSKGLLNEFNDNCYLGKGTWACKWNSWVKNLIFSLFEAVLFMAGVATISASLLSVTSLGILAAEAGVILGDKMIKTTRVGSRSALELMMSRYQGLKQLPVQNIQWGDENSYMMVHERIYRGPIKYSNREGRYKNKRKTLDCTKWCKNTKRNAGNPRNPYIVEGSENKWTNSMIRRLQRFENLPEAPWNCDDVSKKIKLSDTHTGSNGLETCSVPDGKSNDPCEAADKKFLKDQFDKSVTNG